jgi:hypothetical protein
MIWESDTFDDEAGPADFNGALLHRINNMFIRLTAPHCERCHKKILNGEGRRGQITLCEYCSWWSTI